MFVAAPTADVQGTIAEAYQHDPALTSKWLNVAGSGVDSCVKDQVDALTVRPDLQFYRVTEGDEFVGYFGHEKDGQWMSTIFIMPQFRPRKREFWKVVAEHMKPVWYCGGYVKNQPACKFYEKFGVQRGNFDTPNGPAVLFEFQRG